MHTPVWAVLMLARASAEVAADGIFLNAKGQAEAARIEGLIRPARLERAGARRSGRRPGGRASHGS